jgi:hypothetical protein
VQARRVSHSDRQKFAAELALPQDVLEKFYWKNAERIIGVK